MAQQRGWGWKAIRSFLARSRAAGTRRRSPHLSILQLEDRTVPAAVAWDGGAGTFDWNDADNWDTDALPGINDDVTIDVAGTITVTHGANDTTINSLSSAENLVLSGGSLTLNTTSAIQETFTLSGGTLHGAGDLTVNGLLTWTNGTMDGAGVTNAQGGLAINTVNFSDAFLGRTLNNAGAATLASGGLAFGPTIADAGVLNNLAGATFTVANSAALSEWWTNAGHAFNNQGTFTKSGTGTTTSITGVDFNNTGIVEVLSGNLDLDGGGVSSSSFTVSDGATLGLGGGHTLTDTSSVSGAGSVQFLGEATLNGSYDITGTTEVMSDTVTFTASATITNIGSSLAIAGGTLDLSSGETVQPTTFTQSGGTLSGSDTLSVTGVTNWTAGTMDGAGVTNAQGGLAINTVNFGNAQLGRTLNNSGIATLSGAGLGFGSTPLLAGVLNNLVGATFTVADEADLAEWFVNANNAFNNQGTFTKSGAGTTTSTPGVDFNNSGSVSVLSGTLDLDSGGASSGSFTVAANSTLALAGGHTLDGSSTVSGAGKVQFNGDITVNGTYNLTGTTEVTSGTTTFPAAATITNVGSSLSVSGGTLDLSSGEAVQTTTLTLSGGTLSGSDTLSVTGVTNWTAGTMDGAGVTNAQGGLAINTVNFGNALLGRTLNNSGAATLSGAGLGFGSTPLLAGVLNNLVGATFTAGDDADLAEWWPNLNNVFNNQGTFTKSGAGTTTSTPGIDFNNSGTVSVLSGILDLSRGGNSSGSFTVAANSTLSLAGTHTLDGSSTVSGAGKVQLNGDVTVNGTYNLTGTTEVTNGTATFQSAATITNVGSSLLVSAGTLDLSSGEAVQTTTLTLSGGTLTGSDTLSITGMTNWTAGTMDGTGITNAQGGLQINTLNVGNTLLGRTLNNSGAATLSGAGLGFGATPADPGVFNNLVGATFTVADNADLLEWFIHPNNAFNNQGTFTKSGVGTTSTTSVDFNNTGSVSVLSGTLDLNGGGVHQFNGTNVLATQPGSRLQLSASLTGTTTNLDQYAPLGTTILSGGSMGSPLLLEVMGRDLGNVAVGFQTNFAYGLLQLDSAFVQLADNSDNAFGADPEALYLDALIVPVGSTLDLNSLNVYVRNMQIDGTILNGAVTLVNDGGPIAFFIPTSGTVSAVAEQDEWTFSGLAGKTVTVIANPGDATSPPPITPTLDFIDVRLIDPMGNEIATGSSLVAGQTVQLSNIVLPADGTYTVRVKAPAAQPNSQGNYLLTVQINNEAPVLASIGNRNVDEESVLSFVVSATDADVPPDTLTYSASNLPAGAAFNPTTRTFTWTPTEAQGPGSFQVNFSVSDGIATDFETITITVNEVNLPPVLAAIGDQSVDEEQTLSFTISASDQDLPANTLTYSATGLPTGATFNPATRTFSWTPTEAQGPGSFQVTFEVSDGITTDSEIVTITVNEINQAPVLAPIGDQSIDEEQTLTFVINATDADLPANTLTYSATGLPTGATFNPTTRTFSWTPTEAQGPGSFQVTFEVSDGITTDSEIVTITVNEVNLAPILAPIGDQSIDELQTLTFIISGSDVDLPANTLTYSATGLPTGATFNPATQTFTWTPTEAQGPGSFQVTFEVSDGTLTDSEIVTITVAEVNQAPVLTPIGDQSVDEEQTLNFKIFGTDLDLPANTLTYSATGLPAGATFNPATQIFNWTPTEAQGPGSFQVTFEVSDGITTDSEIVTITVNEVNQAPVLAPIGDQSVDEEQTLTFVINATDGDLPANTLTYSATGLPAGATFNPATRTFTWTPPEGPAPDSVQVTFEVSDGVVTDSETITITVNEANRAPVLAPIGAQSVDEEQTLSFVIDATDTDLPVDTLTYSATGLPAGATFNPATRTFSWTPTEAQGPGSFPVTFEVSDGITTDSEIVTITVNEINQAPVLAPIGDQSIDEEQTLSFVINATDGDLPANTLTYSATGLPAGATFNPATRTFTWTPPEGPAPDSVQVTFEVSDGVVTDSETITITVNEANRAPVLAPIGAQSVDEEQTLTFVIDATDTDLPVDTLTYSATGLPTGATFNPATRTFSWTPTEAQGPGSFQVTFEVSDGITTDTEIVTITVNEINQAPVLAPIGDQSIDEEQLLSFVINAADADLPANTLTYSATGLPTGATFNPATRTFSWTPTEAQGPGSFQVTFEVSDGITTDSEIVTITVNEVGQAPVLAPIGDQSIDEEQTLSFVINATDADLPANTLTYSATGLPAGATFNPATRTFSWTPTEAQGSGSFQVTFEVSDGVVTDSETITITVNEANRAPVLDPIGPQSVDEEQTLSFVINAADTDLPADTLTYSATGLPTGATFNPTTRTFSWTPTEAQGPGSFQITFEISDGITTDSEIVTITVNEINQAPVLAAIGPQSVDEGQTLTFVISGSDPDLPANTLTYSVTGLPPGAAFNAGTQTFTWTPTEAQAPGSFQVTFEVSDGTLTDSEIVTITVDEVNQAPVLAAIGNQSVDEQQTLSFVINATDGDLPANALTFSATGLPAGAAFNPATRTFTWTPTAAQGPGTFQVTFGVTDGLVNDTETITITVRDVPLPPPPPPPAQVLPRGVFGALVRKKTKKGTRLFIRTFYRDTGEIKSEVLSPFQLTNGFAGVRPLAQDTTGDGIPDTVTVFAKKGKKSFMRIVG